VLKGWEPSNYVSSRNARNERKEARPEDFMDEEDLQACALSLFIFEYM
jgi:G patch domain-containing protein 1